ncbi:DUF1564 family protein [Leptospira barantonii]|uniref:DUF1564 family protein n=1 Tax=Leptospira barantonii TaxID=2023184 RepID=A0ABX4NFJ4_9LEPT|nr:DUF1564 family protein [Leptospira barantonii]PJZ55522.1 hypothetical protein CH367_20205 [Leptospira barantonii]
MNIKNLKKPVRHLRLLKPNRSGRNQSKQKNLMALDSQRNLKKLGSPSDLNVPKELVPYLDRRIRSAGSMRLLLNQCICNRSVLFLIQKQNAGEKISYQKQKLELQRYPFRPFEDDWVELRRLAFLHGVSMCRMFVRLLETDLYPESKFAENLVLEKLPPEVVTEPKLFEQTGT